jgi:uncharacterized protein
LLLAIKRKKNTKREHVGVRYFFYTFAIVLVLLTGYYVYAFEQGTVSVDTLNANASITLSLMFSVFVVAYLLFRGWTLKAIIRYLGLSRDKFNVAALVTGIKLLAIVFMFEIAVSLFSQATNVQLPTNVGTVLQGFPIYFLIFSFLIAPINEEVLFRAYLIPWFAKAYTSVAEAFSFPGAYEASMVYVYRSGLAIISSAIIFAVLHSGYMSISEFAAAMLFGLVAGYYYTRKGSLYATIFAHAIVNLIAVLAFVSLGAAAVS